MSINIDINSQADTYNLKMETVPYLKIAVAIVIKEARTNAGISQHQLADFAGLSRSYIAAVEAAKTGFSGDALFLIADVLKILPEELISRIDMLRHKKPDLPETDPGRPRKELK